MKTEDAILKKLRTPKGFPSKGYDDDKIQRIMKTFDWLKLFSEQKVDKKDTYPRFATNLPTFI